MKPIKQDKFHSETTRGNCMQAAVASILGLELSEVPNFVEEEHAWSKFHRFIEERGFYVIRLDGNYSFPFYHLASGTSPRNPKITHMVVMKERKCVHDPHPDDQGIIGINDIYILVPFDPEKVKAA